MRLFYLPLEPYAERYTSLMSCVGGWAETHFVQQQVQFTRIDGESLGGTITAGVVLDAYGRSHYAMSQVQRTIELLRNGTIKAGDVIYTEDFWHPGIESLFYIRAITGVAFKIGCFLHAQSVDEYDFTYSMRDWMRPLEIGMSRQYDYIFVCSSLLKDRCVRGGYKAANIYVVGLPYNSTRLRSQLFSRYGLSAGSVHNKKPGTVIFSSRFDSEKNPHFFLDLVEACPDVEFTLVNPRRDRPLSNDPTVMTRLSRVPKNLRIVDTHDKKDYYTELAAADVQFNCAKQDWVSWTLLEAITFRCKPLYPAWRDFPDELAGFSASLYDNCSLASAVAHLRLLLAVPFDYDLVSVVQKHDASWSHYLKIMGFTHA